MSIEDRVAKLEKVTQNKEELKLAIHTHTEAEGTWMKLKKTQNSLYEFQDALGEVQGIMGSCPVVRPLIKSPLDKVESLTHEIRCEIEDLLGVVQSIEDEALETERLLENPARAAKHQK